MVCPFRQDREKHLQTLGAANKEEAEIEDAQTTNTSSVNKDHLGVMGKFENSGLAEFLRGSVECRSNFELIWNCAVS